MEHARARKFACLLVWKLDRFGRSLVDCLNNIKTLEDHGIRFIAVTQGLDTDLQNPASRFLLHVLGAAEFERALIREWTLAGRLRYKRDFESGKVGKTVYSRSGRNMPPHRPRKVFNGEQVLELRRQGLSMRQIAKRLGLAGFGQLYSRYFQLSTGRIANFLGIQYYGKKYPIKDCRSGVCYDGWLMWNGYLPANRVNSYDSKGNPNGVMGVPADYKPYATPLWPIPKDGGSPSDPLYGFYDTNTLRVPLQNGTVQRTSWSGLRATQAPHSESGAMCGADVFNLVGEQ